MAKTCKLAPKADATLHALIVELLQGAALLTENPNSQEAFAAITKVLRQYPEYFDDPGWTPLPGAQT
ncbi:MAG: hypothetical protein Q7S40_23035 [Opitutaceae bacterium]|nr:hypothetical protein [Opitutaceae bacterium]